MDFKVNIRGLGNIDNLDFHIKPLTVIAGENSTGKSFATKSIYCVLEALNKNYVSSSIDRDARLFLKCLEFFEQKLGAKAAAVDFIFLNKINKNSILAFNTISEFLNGTRLSEQETGRVEFKGEVQSLSSMLEEIESYIKNRGDLQKLKVAKKYLIDAEAFLRKIILSLEDYHPTIVDGIKIQLSDNFKKNFQVTKLASLINSNKSSKAGINIESIGNVKVEADDKMSFSFAADGIDKIQKFENVIFIDSPVYLKIRKGIESNGGNLFFKSKNERYLKGYPSYIDNLYSFIDKQFLDKPDFSEISDELREVLSGRLNVTKSGDIDYLSKDGVSIPLSLTAMGISNLGLIDLLISNNIIKKGSFLIIDEPEAHIHPKWQVVLMELLYKMAKAGANVIIATHSLDMVKKLELLAKQDPQSEDIISVHKMPSSKLASESSLQEKISEVLEDLSTPFYQMYMEDID